MLSQRRKTIFRINVFSHFRSHFFVLLLAGCSKVLPPDDGFVSCTVADRIEAQVEWRHGNCQEENVRAFITCTVSNKLTADGAIQVALLNNPKIQAMFEELGIAQANLVEAGLLTNPSFEIEARFSPLRSLVTNIEYLIVSSLLDAFLIPLKKQLAATEFAQAQLRVANQILDLAFDVRDTYYELVLEREKKNIFNPKWN